jgi:hypothetical protein
MGSQSVEVTINTTLKFELSVFDEENRLLGLVSHQDETLKLSFAVVFPQVLQLDFRSLSPQATENYFSFALRVSNVTLSLPGPKNRLLGTSETDVVLNLLRGGFQEARGDCGNGGSNDWFIENALSLLNSPGEFYLDLPNQKLYFFPPPSLDVVREKPKIELTVSRGLLHAVGTQSLTVTNVEFTHTYATHMDDTAHEMPSGGDWSVTRQAAVVLEDVRYIQVLNCSFRHLGGNGLLVSKRAQHVSLLYNVFDYLGSSSILLVGDPLFSSPTAYNRELFPNRHVEFIVIRSNVMSNLGLVVKQSSGVFFALAKSVLVEQNVMYNIPRAGITYNDGFGGNITVVHNVLFNTVLETLDHGPLNVWDRQQWIEPPGKLPFVIASNLFLGNMGGSKGIDLDDGARNFVVQNNVVIHGLLKFKGANIMAERNLIIPIDWGCFLMTPFNDPKGSSNLKLQNNTCVSHYNGRLPPYYFNVGTQEAKNICELRNFHAVGGNRYFGTSSQWVACGAGKITWNKWMTQFSQEDAFSEFVPVRVPTLEAEAQMILDHLDWV